MRMRKQPVSNAFAEISILGFFVSTLLLSGDLISLPWGVTFFIFFLIMFIASLMNLKA